jgi:carbonic anhydrase
MYSHLRMADLAEKGQRPFAIVLTCSDSRSPAEMIFDQGLGDLFVVRVAGNIIAPSLLASIEFAAANFGSSLILVMGHTKCGAVEAAYKHALKPYEKLPSANLEVLVSSIRPAVDLTLRNIPAASDEQKIGESIIQNVRRSQNLIVEQSAIVRDLVSHNKLGIAGAVLEIGTGRVNFLDSQDSIESATDAQGVNLL